MTTVLAYSLPTALLAIIALTTVRTSAAHLALRAVLHPVLAWPLCVRGSLPLHPLVRPITITGLDLYLVLELSLSRDFGTDSLEVGAPPRRHPVPNPSPPAAPARKCQPRANFLVFPTQHLTVCSLLLSTNQRPAFRRIALGKISDFSPLCFGLLIAGDTQRSAQPSSSHRTQTVIMAAFTVGMSGAYTPTHPVHHDTSPPHRTSSGRHRPSESTKPCNIDIHFPDGERTHQPSIPRPIQQPPPPPGPSPSSPARDPSSSAPPSPSPAPPSAPRLRAPTSNPTTSPSSSRADRASPWTSSASSRTRARG